MKRSGHKASSNAAGAAGRDGGDAPVDAAQMILDGDFSCLPKPANQIPLAEYFKYMEQNYLRPLAEDDLGLLREPQDNFSPYVFPTPPPQPNYYLQLWALEDEKSVALSNAFHYPAHFTQPHNYVEQRNGDVGRGQVDLGPLTARILQSLVELQVLPIPPGLADLPLDDDSDGDAPLDSIDVPEPKKKLKTASGAVAVPRRHGALPARNVHDMDMLEERIKRELFVVGILSEKDVNVNLSDKDELGHELRSLQTALHDVAERNAWLRTRLLDVATGYKAMEEYEQVHDEVREQLRASYVRRYGKSKKNKLKKAPAAGGSSTSLASTAASDAPAVDSDAAAVPPLAALAPSRDSPAPVPGPVGPSALSDELLHKMARQRQLQETVGRFFDHARFPYNPGETIFDPERLPPAAFSQFASES